MAPTVPMTASDAAASVRRRRVLEYELGAIVMSWDPLGRDALQMSVLGRRTRRAHITAPFPLHESFVIFQKLRAHVYKDTIGLFLGKIAKL